MVFHHKLLYNNSMPIKPKLRREIFKRDNWTCQYCGRKAPFVELEIEHKKSKKDGGADNVENLTTSCFECNRGKASQSLTAPQDPTIISRLLVDEYIKILVPLWHLNFPNVLIPEGKIRKALYFLSLEKIEKAIRICGTKITGIQGRDYSDVVNAYFYGILKKMSNNFTTKPDKWGI